MKCLMFFAAACICSVCNAEGGRFWIDVDLGEKPLKEVVEIAVPKGAEKASKRYFDLAEATHPNLLKHDFAVVRKTSGKGSGSATNEVTVVDKEVEYAVRAKGKQSFVLMVANRKSENVTAEIELKRGKLMAPVYRRVYSEDNGRSWVTMAYQPPRDPGLRPWTVEIPSNTVQTVTIGVK